MEKKLLLYLHMFITEDYYNLGLRVCLYNVYGGCCLVSKLLEGCEIGWVEWADSKWVG